MKRFTMIALTNAKPGRDAELLDWYENVHLAEMLSVPGVVSAQLGTLATGAPQYRYTGIYMVEADDPAPMFAEMMRRYATGEMTACDALDPASYNGVFECAQSVTRA